MSTGPHVIAITLLIAWVLAVVAASMLTSVQFLRDRGRVPFTVIGLVLLWVSVLIQILYWLGVGD